MMPRLGNKHDFEIQVTSHPREHYSTREYLSQGLPAAPAIMVGEEVVVAGSDIPEDKLEAVICRHLGKPSPTVRKRGLLERLFNR